MDLSRRRLLALVSGATAGCLGAPGQRPGTGRTARSTEERPGVARNYRDWLIGPSAVGMEAGEEYSFSAIDWTYLREAEARSLPLIIGDPPHHLGRVFDLEPDDVDLSIGVEFAREPSRGFDVHVGSIDVDAVVASVEKMLETPRYDDLGEYRIYDETGPLIDGSFIVGPDVVGVWQGAVQRSRKVLRTGLGEIDQSVGEDVAALTRHLDLGAAVAGIVHPDHTDAVDAYGTGLHLHGDVARVAYPFVFRDEDAVETSVIEDPAIGPLLASSVPPQNFEHRGRVVTMTRVQPIENGVDAPQARTFTVAFPCCVVEEPETSLQLSFDPWTSSVTATYMNGHPETRLRVAFEWDGGGTGAWAEEATATLFEEGATATLSPDGLETTGRADVVDPPSIAPRDGDTVAVTITAVRRDVEQVELRDEGEL